MMPISNNCIIPEIRVYSPSSQGDNSNDEPLLNGSNGSSNELEDKDSPANVIPWENTFHMRTYNLSNFPVQSSTYRATYRSQSVSIHRARMGCITSSAKSLNVLRQLLQHSINKEINEIMQKYLDKFFRPAIENIKSNNGVNSVSDQHVQAVCRQILEEGKKMYFGGNSTRANSPVSTYGNTNTANDANLSDNENYNDNNRGRKRGKDSDSDSETSSLHTLKPVVRRKKLPTHKHINSGNGGISGRVTPSKIHVKAVSNNDGVKREGPKWDPSRLSTETRFVLGSKANKALGFGSTRGRLYTKHPDLFRYIGDQEDKQWLHDNHLMPPAGGRAYLLIKEDILDLINSEEYKNAPGVNANDMGLGFTVPENMIRKMKILMQSLRNSESSRKKIEAKTRTLTPTSMASVSTGPNDIDSSTQPSVETNQPESGAISPADDLEGFSAEITDPSPFSVGAFCDTSPNENQEPSPNPSDISTTTLNEIPL